MVGLRSNDAMAMRRSTKNRIIGLMSKTTTSHMHHTFLHISLSFLHYYDVIMRSVFESFSPAHTKTLINGNTIESLTEHVLCY